MISGVLKHDDKVLLFLERLIGMMGLIIKN
jgi:hypothetical protein